jgi:hypothetical protein
MVTDRDIVCTLAKTVHWPTSKSFSLRPTWRGSRSKRWNAFWLARMKPRAHFKHTIDGLDENDVRQERS